MSTPRVANPMPRHERIARAHQVSAERRGWPSMRGSYEDREDRHIETYVRELAKVLEARRA